MNNTTISQPEFLAEATASQSETALQREKNDANLSLHRLDRNADRRASDEERLSEYDKILADSFPASDPPTQP